jgi:hypothetical protein
MLFAPFERSGCNTEFQGFTEKMYPLGLSFRKSILAVCELDRVTDRVEWDIGIELFPAAVAIVACSSTLINRNFSPLSETFNRARRRRGSLVR